MIQALVATDFGIVKKNKQYYAKTALASILRRYYDSFGSLVVCMPLRQPELYRPEMEEISDILRYVVPASKPLALLHFGGRDIAEAVSNADIVIVRCASFVGFYVADIARRMKKPVLAEGMNCAWDAFWNHGIAGKFLAPYMEWKMKSVFAHAEYALYVTQDFLQSRYVCKNLTVGVSNVQIGDISEHIMEKRRKKIVEQAGKKTDICLMTCAAVDVRFKGQHFVIQAISELKKMGYNVVYTCVGGGDQTYLKRIARQCHVEEQVIFTGVIPHSDVFKLLDQCDIYIQPSLQEGLPRAMIEAMSRGCPCIGARTAGIPELIPEECLVERKAVHQIAEKILDMETSGLLPYAELNFRKAAEYCDEALAIRRNGFFDQIKLELSDFK